ncbi:MAG: 2-C-methyl-D-erythritol 4-phosphate cytidylyltransferase [Methylovulum sp.]|nr:2-C-methyl-D-erythritol 4-phosphate cytidylyltransferase [Methylovulum sp.]
MSSGSAPRLHQDLSILIPAAGRGERLGLGPKACLELAGQPLVVWVTRKALQVCDDVVVAAPPGYLEIFRTLCPDCRIIEGGSTHQQSVGMLLDATNRDWVMTTIVARPFVSVALLDTVLDKAKEIGAAGAFLGPDVPVAQIADNQVVRDFCNHEIGFFQSPQAFSRILLKQVYAQAAQQGWIEQSPLQLVLRAGKKAGVVTGEKTNIKLTTSEDWLIAQLFTAYL